MKKLIFTLLVACIPLFSFAQSIETTPEVEHEVVIYPNPAHGEYIQIESKDIRAVEIMNILGRKVFTRKAMDHNAREMEIRINDFDQGLYLVKVTFRDKKTVLQKVLVK